MPFLTFRKDRFIALTKPARFSTIYITFTQHGLLELQFSVLPVILEMISAVQALMHMEIGGHYAVELLQTIDFRELRIPIQAEVCREDTSQAQTALGIRAHTALHSR